MKEAEQRQVNSETGLRRPVRRRRLVVGAEVVVAAKKQTPRKRRVVTVDINGEATKDEPKLPLGRRVEKFRLSRNLSKQRFVKRTIPPVVTAEWYD